MFANAIDAPTDSVPPSLDDGFADDPADRGLTPEQQAAVDHRGGHLLIVAGAGTGKTTTLIARLASLIASGVAPEQIMLLTFSRRAATELDQIDTVSNELAARYAVIPLQTTEPVGAEALHDLTAPTHTPSPR